MAGWDTRFFDDFDDNAIGIQTDLGNGTITEPVGSDLVLSCAPGIHCNWGHTEQDGPIGYELITSHVDPVVGLLLFETRVSNVVASTTHRIQGLCLYDDRDNAYQFGWYDDNDDMYVQLIFGGSHATPYQAGNYGSPATTPHIYQIYWNRLPRKVYLPGMDQTLDPFELGFRFSADDGSSWVWAVKQVSPFTPTKFGVFFRNFVNWPSVTASFDYLKLEQDLEPDFYIGDQENNDPQTSASVEDTTEVVGSGGPPVHGDGVSKGQRLPGPLHQTTASQGPFDDAAVEDEFTRLDAGGDPAYGNEPSLGQMFRDPSAQVEDLLLAGVVDATFLVEKLDGDGQSLLYDTDVRGVHLIDAAAGSFGTPVGNHHWGAAQDGKFYADGVACSPGVFGTLAGGPDHSHWCFTGIEPFDVGGVGNAVSMIADDQARMSITGYAGGYVSGAMISSSGKWCLQGDFDIQVDFAGVTMAGTAWNLAMYVYTNFGGSEGNNRIRVGYDNNTRYYSARDNNGVYSEKGSVAAPGVTSGRIRLVRTGTSYQAYYWTGGAWATIGAAFSDTNIGSSDCFVQLHLDVNNCNGSVDWVNFTINSGAATNYAGWYSEASGDHRGTQGSMPDNLLAICTETSVDLVDVDNTKLWLRLVRSGNNALHYYSSYGQRPRRAFWKNGVLIIAHGSTPSQSEEGGAIVVDFTMDSIRIHRKAASPICGGWYRGTFWRAGGAIRDRNGNHNYSTDHDEWDIPDYRVYDVALFEDGGNIYHAVATVDGMVMSSWARWETETDLENSYSTEVSHMLWCLLDQSDGELFYMDASNMYSRDKTGAGQGWEDWMHGGNWVREYEKALPGTRTFDFQYHAVRQGTFLFIPANEGVYRVNWPSGSWTLFFGKVGSGATHEILPSYKLVTGLAVANDGSVDTLVIAMEDGQRGQVTAVKIVDNTVYANAKTVDLKVPSVVAANG